MQVSSVQAMRDAAAQKPDLFWAEAARDIDWDAPFTSVVPTDTEPAWFAGGRLNICYNALDRHVQNGRAEQPALIYDSPLSGLQQTYSFAELTDAVAHTAGAMRRCGVKAGDRVLLYMPMVPQAVIAMLACARIGAVHSVVFGGFAAAELATRIDDAQPVLLLTATCGLEPGRVVDYQTIVHEALQRSARPALEVVMLERPQQTLQPAPNITPWSTWLDQAEAVECLSVAAEHPLYVLYTSGTTGKPKGITRDTGGHAVALLWSMRHVYAMQPGETFWAASDIGWVVGHSYIVYAPLLMGCTTVLYEGKPVGTPDASAFWRVIAEHQVDVLFTAPTALRAIRSEDPRGELIPAAVRSHLRALFLAGERTDLTTLEWAIDQLSVPVIDHWWQTELGWPALGRCMGVAETPAQPGSAGRPVPGFNVVVLDDTGRECAPQQEGHIAIRLPLPPGAATGLWNRPGAFAHTYLQRFDGAYDTGDAGYRHADGSVFIGGRQDDLINVAGHRLSTGAMEEVVAGHGAVAECAVVGCRDALKGQRPVAVVVMRPDHAAAVDEVRAELVLRVRTEIGPVAALKEIHVVSALPKTRSGKVLRNVLRAMLDGDACSVPGTIEDPSVIDILAHALTPLQENEHDR